MRIWRGWTTRANADAYQALLLKEIFPGIAARGIAGYRGISLGRREIDSDVEFVTIMWFDSIDAVRSFAGEQFDVAVVPQKARALLARYDSHAAHYETVVSPPAAPPRP